MKESPGHFSWRELGPVYFDFHHSARDRREAVESKELHAGAGAVAILTYLLAEKGV